MWPFDKFDLFDKFNLFEKFDLFYQFNICYRFDLLDQFDLNMNGLIKSVFNFGGGQPEIGKNIPNSAGLMFWSLL